MHCISSRNFLVLLALGWASLSGAQETKKAPKPLTPYQKSKTIDMNATVEMLSPPDDVDRRLQRFSDRNSPETVKQLADELFALWDWDESQSSPFKFTRHLNPQKKNITRLYEQGNYQEALDAFRAYFFARIQLLWKDEKGLASNSFNRRAANKLFKQNMEDTVTLLMRNTYQTKTTKQTVHLGEMGALRWDWEPEGLQNVWYTPKVFEYFSNNVFATLWWKFVDTQDRNYLDKWIDYLDDYTLNNRFLETLNPLNLDYGKKGLGDAEFFLFALSEISRKLPESGEGFPSTTLARALIRQLTVTIPQSLYYNREQSNNHSTGATQVMLGLSTYLYDFTLARTLETESRRQFESYATLNELADGSMPGRATGYSRHEFQENAIYLNRLMARNPTWLTPKRVLAYKERLFLRAYWYINMFSPSGEASNGLSGDRRNSSFSYKVNVIGDALPEAFTPSALWSVALRIMQNQLEPDWRGETYMAPNSPLLQEGMGSHLSQPPFTSLTFPYGSTSFMRSGWDPQDDQYGVFLSNTGRGRNGGLFRRAKNSGSLTVSAFNQWLLVNGTEKIYNFTRSPIQVDGLDQFARVGLTAHGRRGENNIGLSRIAPWRNHHSEHFDLVESAYDGVYTDSPDHEPALYNYETNLKNLEGSISGITHSRMVQFVKEHGVWIVVDVMESDKPHTYRQQWWVTKLTDKRPSGYTEDQFDVDVDGQAIHSSAENKVNLSMYHAGPVSLSAENVSSLSYAPVKTYIKQEGEYKGYRADRSPGVAFLHLTGEWDSSPGKSQLITVIYPRKTIEDDIVVERAENGKSVTIQLQSGAKIDFTADGMESTLVVTEPDGVQRGLVVQEEQSFEFEGDLSRDSASGSRSPIYRTIKDLEIMPDVAAFTDSIEVKMISPTEGVDIRYTTDGSNPTLNSPLYTHPLTFDGSVELKARGFRKSVTTMPDDRVSGTHMTRVFNAYFTKALPHDPLPESHVSKLKPGLSYSYYEDEWPKLLFGAPVSEEIKSGVVSTLFDVSPRSKQGNQAFAFRYEGYMEATKSGLYTLYAPKEFTHYAPLAGYDLHVELGFQNRWHKGSKREVGPNKPLQNWYPVTGRHAFGTWSIYLKKGFHPIRIYYADIRPGGFLEYMQFSYDGANVPGLIPRYFDGDVPTLEISGPGLTRQPIPTALLNH